VTAVGLDRIFSFVEAETASEDFLRKVGGGMLHGFGGLRLDDQVGVIGHLTHAGDESEDVRVVVEYLREERVEIEGKSQARSTPSTPTPTVSPAAVDEKRERNAPFPRQHKC
jgi:hypothetical protein